MTANSDNLMYVPQTYQSFKDNWQQSQSRLLALYQQGQCSFVPHLLPEQAIELTGEETLAILQARLGDKLTLALSPEQTNPTVLASPIPSPVAAQPNGNWLKQTNMVGINVRTIANFWNVIKYTLTLPAHQDSLHLLPIWETGVVGSLYGMSSWQINPEFYSPELAQLQPHLNTVERQLKAVINLLHAMGKAVGMDVIPHTDRFSEMALANPHYFEWLQRKETEIVTHVADLHLAVQNKIRFFVALYDSAVEDKRVPATVEAFFYELTEAERLAILFGQPTDYDGRLNRRVALIKFLYKDGYEPVPATMAPPYRGLKVDVSPEAQKLDENGLLWRDFTITQPQAMSRVFGPLGRYKLYEAKDDNINWEIDFSQPRHDVWQYVCEKYYDIQRHYQFDFMRGDMSHVQMQPDGVPAIVDDYYDPLKAVKHYIQKKHGVSYFGYFAETFLAPRNVMAYGDEVDHLEACDADSTLGDLQSAPVSSVEFRQQFSRYCNLLTTRTFAPNFTVITADKDDPRFDKFYLTGNELRLFMAFFLADMPSYMSLGFETRDPHPEPAPNEHYTKLYVFHETIGAKATFGPYIWGKNGALYHHVTRLKLYAEQIGTQIKGRATRWLLPPDPMGDNPVIAWTQQGDHPAYLFVANLDTAQEFCHFTIPTISPNITTVTAEFSTVNEWLEADKQLHFNGKSYHVTRLAPGEGRVYRLT